MQELRYAKWYERVTMCYKPLRAFQCNDYTYFYKEHKGEKIIFEMKKHSV